MPIIIRHDDEPHGFLALSLITPRWRRLIISEEAPTLPPCLCIALIRRLRTLLGPPLDGLRYYIRFRLMCDSQK